MAIKKRLKRQRVTIVIPAGTPNGQTVEPATDYKPDSDYRNIIGVWAKVTSALGNQLGVDIQLRDGQGNIAIDLSDSELWRGGTGLAPEDMFVPVLLPITNSIIRPGAQAQGPAAPSADITVQFVFLLSDELIEVANA